MSASCFAAAAYYNVPSLRVVLRRAARGGVRPSRTGSSLQHRAPCTGTAANALPVPPCAVGA